MRTMDCSDVDNEIVENAEKKHYFSSRNDDDCLPGILVYACVTVVPSGAKGKRTVINTLTDLRKCMNAEHNIGVSDRSLFPIQVLATGQSERSNVLFEYSGKPPSELPNRFFLKMVPGNTGDAIERRCFECSVKAKAESGVSGDQDIIGGTVAIRVPDGFNNSEIKYNIVLKEV